VKVLSTARLAIMLSSVLIVSLGSTAAASKLLYQDNIMTPNGTQQSVTAWITIAPQPDGTRLTIAATGQPAVSVTIPPNGSLPAPQGTPSPQRAQGMLIIQRVVLLGRIRRALSIHGPVEVQIPVLAPGASEPLELTASLAQPSAAAPALSASASTSTTATIDVEKAKIHGILPARRVAERVKNAVTPAHVTLPDKITASVHVTISGTAVGKMSGRVAHELTAHGQTTTLNETWSLKPSP
jgi:hypothetical protein